MRKEKRQQRKPAWLQAAMHNVHTLVYDAGGRSKLAEKLAAVSTDDNHVIR